MPASSPPARISYCSSASFLVTCGCSMKAQARAGAAAALAGSGAGLGAAAGGGGAGTGGTAGEPIWTGTRDVAGTSAADEAAASRRPS